MKYERYSFTVTTWPDPMQDMVETTVLRAARTRTSSTEGQTQHS